MTTDTRLGLFAEALLTGLLVFVAALPVVTAFAAFTAGCALLRDRDETGAGVRPFLSRFGAVLRTGPAGVLAPLGVLFLLYLYWVALRAGAPALPIGFPLVVSGTFALRAAAAWRPGTSWPRVWRDAAADCRRDPAGTLLLALAVAVCLAVSVLIPVSAPLVLGQLVLAAVARSPRPQPL